MSQQTRYSVDISHVIAPHRCEIYMVTAFLDKKEMGISVGKYFNEINKINIGKSVNVPEDKQSSLLLQGF